MREGCASQLRENDLQLKLNKVKNPPRLSRPIHKPFTGNGLKFKRILVNIIVQRDFGAFRPKPSDR
jgi:hypothetical protein